MFRPTQNWADRLCRELSYNGAEGVMVIKAVDAPPEISPSGILTLSLEFRNGNCVRAVLAEADQDGDYVIEGSYDVFMKIFEGKLPAFAAFALGRLRLAKGPLSRLADYMPLALEIVNKARRAAGF